MSNEDLLAVQRRLQERHGIAPPAAPDPAAVAEGMLDMVAAKVEETRVRETEYLGEDGMLYCKICHGPRQCIAPGVPELGIPPRKVGRWCNCPTEYDKLKQQERLDEIARSRSVCFRDMPKFQGWTFDRADNAQRELMQAAREYADQFQEHLRDGRGLLFYGTVGTGKSVAAACIANAVINQGYRPKMTSITDVADEIWNATNKAEYMEHLCKYDLLILDDLGAERQTPYMQEMVYKIINARYTQGGPMIITTNLTKEELGNPADIGYKRVYSRILEWSLAVSVDGKDRRMQAAAENKNIMRKQLGIGGAGT